MRRSNRKTSTALLVWLVAAAALLAAAADSGRAQQAQDTADATVRLRSAVAVSRTKVRLRFAEPAGRTLSAADVLLTMGGESRRVTRVTMAADRESAEVDATPAWYYGTAGSVRLREGIDARSGGEAEPVRVWAAPGDAERPALSRVRLSRKVVCMRRLSRNCSLSGGAVGYRVDEPVSIVLDVRRRRGDASSVLKFGRPAGAGIVRFKEKIEGLRLWPGRYIFTVYAVDAANNESRRFTLRLRVRR